MKEKFIYKGLINKINKSIIKFYETQKKKQNNIMKLTFTLGENEIKLFGKDYIKNNKKKDI